MSKKIIKQTTYLVRTGYSVDETDEETRVSVQFNKFSELLHAEKNVGMNGSVNKSYTKPVDDTRTVDNWLDEAIENDPELTSTL